MANVSGCGVNLGFVFETAAKTFSIDMHYGLRELRASCSEEQAVTLHLDTVRRNQSRY
jgi:hypothetical protein